MVKSEFPLCWFIIKNLDHLYGLTNYFNIRIQMKLDNPNY